MSTPALCLLLLAAAPAPATPAAPPPAPPALAGYARASSQLKEDAKPALYPAIHLLDGREATAWCEGVEGDGSGEQVRIGFRGEVEIDEVRVITGEARDAASFKAHHRVKALELKTAEKRHTFVLADSTEPQAFKLETPIEAERVTLEIVAVERGVGEDDAACLTDVVFLSGGKPLNGAMLSGLRYEKGRAQLMGTWYAGPAGARDRFLDFYFDGTFRYSHRPFDPEEKGAEIDGDYAFDGEKLRLKLGKAWVEVKAAPRAKGEERILELEGKGLEGTLAGAWSDER